MVRSGEHVSAEYSSWKKNNERSVYGIGGEPTLEKKPSKRQKTSELYPVGVRIKTECTVSSTKEDTVFQKEDNRFDILKTPVVNGQTPTHAQITQLLNMRLDRERVGAMEQNVPMVSPMRDLTSRFTSAVGKTSREMFDRAVVGLEDSINEDISYIGKKQSDKATPPDLVLHVLQRDQPTDSVDNFYTGQLGGPTLRTIIEDTVKAENKSQEKHHHEYHNDVGEEEASSVLRGPKEQMLLNLVKFDLRCDNVYRWRAQKGLDPLKMSHRPLGAQVSMEYASDFLRQPVGNERTCIRGSSFCLSALIPQMQAYPNTLDTQRTDAGFVGREFFTPTELERYISAGAWPELRGCCFLCLVFAQTIKCLMAIERGVLFPYQIQRFRIKIEEDIGYSRNQCLPIKLDDDTLSGIGDNAIEFRISDYIPDTTTAHVGDEEIEVKCYSQRVHHF